MQRSITVVFLSRREDRSLDMQTGTYLLPQLNPPHTDRTMIKINAMIMARTISFIFMFCSHIFLLIFVPCVLKSWACPNKAITHHRSTHSIITNHTTSRGWTKTWGLQILRSSNWAPRAIINIKHPPNIKYKEPNESIIPPLSHSRWLLSLMG